MTREAESLEGQRIRLLLKRDGRAAARVWAERTRSLYAQAIATHIPTPRNRSIGRNLKLRFVLSNAWLADSRRVESAADQ